jgi:hypothetical protein
MDFTMPKLPPVRKLPEKDCREMLATFLEAIDKHPRLDHFRAAVPGGEERRLALIAAWERAALLGSPAVHPPRHDDLTDVLLCDILDMIERDEELSRHGSYYGVDRHAANLLALGIWDRKNVPTTSVAGQLFTAWLLNRNADAASTSLPSEGHLSPLPPEFGLGGDLIVDQNAAQPTSADIDASPQVTIEASVATSESVESAVAATLECPGLNHHAGQTCGDKCNDALLDPQHLPPRPLRRGRPPLIDDLAKGRLLGMMAHGLSLRQAAAQLGVHHTTLVGVMKRDAEFTQQVAESRLIAISQPLLTVVKASRTNWRAAAWLARFLEERRIRSLETTPEERAIEESRRS